MNMKIKQNCGLCVYVSVPTCVPARVATRMRGVVNVLPGNLNFSRVQGLLQLG